ncbi:amidase domain-containing protein [Salinibacterium sp. ZJ77]|uniref:amidase domain-containing protein n=1 Tax=Salinibacterium sp. ZJ77 TaxID=2708337 RepID=UPI0014210FD8|nr:amidase domain-containing protein [Salinibacterium sp. ZJ77]
MSVLERDPADAAPAPIRPRRDPRVERRRRLRRTILVAVGALAVIAIAIGVIVLPPVVARANAVARYDSARTEIQSIRTTLDGVLGADSSGPAASLEQLDAVLAVESTLIDAAARDELRSTVESATASIIGDDASALSRPALDVEEATVEQLEAESAALEAALPALRDAVAAAPAKADEAAAQIGAAFTAFTDGIRSRGQELYNQWSDAEKSTEDAFFQSIDAALAAAPEELGAALQTAEAASEAMIASAQAYRDEIIAAADGVSTQPTGGDVNAQMSYLLTWWETYNEAEWGDYNPYGGDCVNFTSQGLIQRGWQMDDTWNSPGAKGFASKAWISTTAMEAYLKKLGFRSNDNDHLDRVRVGDVGIFDWGERGGGVDHTMTVSKAEYTADGPVVYFVSHNADGDYRELQHTLFEQHSDSLVRIYSIP